MHYIRHHTRCLRAVTAQEVRPAYECFAPDNAEKLHGVKNRQGHYVCVLVAVRSPDDPEPLIAEGTWEGVIAEAPKGSGGFGYDPYFYLPEAGATAAELSPEAKNASSHRGKALVKMAQLLKDRWGWGAA